MRLASANSSIRHPMQAGANLFACLAAHHCGYQLSQSVCSSMPRTWGSRQTVLKVQGKDWMRNQGLDCSLTICDVCLSRPCSSNASTQQQLSWLCCSNTGTDAKSTSM